MSELQKTTNKKMINDQNSCLFNEIQVDLIQVKKNPSQGTLTDNQIQSFHSDMKKMIFRNGQFTISDFFKRKDFSN